MSLANGQRGSTSACAFHEHAPSNPPVRYAVGTFARVGDSADNANGLDSFRVEATRFHAHDPEIAKLEAESLFDAWNLAQNPG